MEDPFVKKLSNSVRKAFEPLEHVKIFAEQMQHVAMPSRKFVEDFSKQIKRIQETITIEENFTVYPLFVE